MKRGRHPRKGDQTRPKPLPAVIERLGNEMRAAGEPVPSGSEDEFKEWFRKSCERELWFFSRWALGNDFLSLGEFHRRDVCPFLTDFKNGRFKLLMLPMGHLKTTVASRSLPLHALIQHASTNIYFPGMHGCNTCIWLVNENGEKSKENLQVLSEHALHNDWLYWLWPNVFWAYRKEAKRWTDDFFEVKRTMIRAEPSVKALGIKGGFIGGYYDIIIADDIAALQASMDPPLMDRCKKFLRASMTRFHDKKIGIHIGIGTHWGANDVYVDWKKDVRVDTMIKSIVQFDDETKQEHPLWPEKYPMDVVEGLRKSSDPIEFALWYMNKPVASGFTTLRWEDLREYMMAPDGSELYFYESPIDEHINQRYQTISKNLGFVIGSARYDPMNAKPRTKIPATMDQDFVEYARLKYDRCEKCGAARAPDGLPTCEHVPVDVQYGQKWLGHQ